MFRVAPDGAVTQIIGATGDGQGHRLDGAVGVSVGEDGDVYVPGFFTDNVFRISLRAPLSCRGDCNGDGVVIVSELITAVKIALEKKTIEHCTAADSNEDGSVGVDEIVGAVGNALTGCPN